MTATRNPATHTLWGSVAVLLLLSAAVQVAGLDTALRYERTAIETGAVWRLLTGHLVHLGPMHLALNAIGTVLVAALVGSHLRATGWAAAWALCALATGLGLWWARPDLNWYVGLSGVLHGLLITGTLAALADRRERPFAALVLLAIVAKLGWEQWRGALPGTAAAAGGAVVVDAHLFGALGGLLAGAVVLGCRAWRAGSGAAGT